MRATISKKLSLPFALFLAPIAYLLVTLTDTHERGISTARNELNGVAPVLSALDVSRALFKLASKDVNVPDLKQTVADFKTSLVPYAGNKLIEEKVEELSDQLDIVMRLNEVSAIDIAASLQNLARLKRLIGDASELILDPELDTYYLMEMLVILSADIAQSKRDMLQDVMLAAAKKQSSVPEGRQVYFHTRELMGLIERLDASLLRIEQHKRSNLVSYASSASERQFVLALQQLKEAWATDANVEVLRRALRESTDKGAVWQSDIANDLTRLLSMRIDSFERLRDRQIYSSAMMFLIAGLCLMWLMRRYVTDPLNTLTGSMIDLADGKLDITLPENGGSGEVGDMIRAVGVFKANAVRNGVLEKEKEEASKALTLAASNLHRAETIAGLGHWRWSLDGNSVEWSPGLFNIMGFNPRSATPRLNRVVRRSGREKRAESVGYLTALVRRHQTHDYSFSFEHPELGERRLHSQVAIERSDSGAVTAMIGIVQDITESYQNERNLQLRTAALAEAQALGRIGDWSYTLGDKHIRWSPEIYALLRYDPATFETTRQAVMAIYDADGADLVLKAQSDVIRTGETRSVDIAAKLGDGTTSDFTVVSKADFDSRGRICGFSGTIQDISERKIAERELEKLAFYDPLTGLANRALFRRSLRREVERAVEDGSSGALMLLDLDRFKEVNDSLGHAAGDELLVLVAGHLRRLLPANAFLARLGGDEFAVVLGGIDAEQAATLGKAITCQIAEPVRLALGEVQIGTSIGIAMFPADGRSQEDLVRNADLALYNAKDDGRSCLRFFTPKLSDAVNEKALIARDLRRAMNIDDQLFVVFQPQVDIQNGRVTGFEALLRWRHPERGLVSPAVFVPIAESSSLIGDLGLYVLRASCFQMKAWLDAGHPARDIAVNVSAAQIWQSDFEGDVKQVLMETGLPPELLTLEVTESVFLREAEGRVRQSLDGLKALGVKLALDDFGTGYSSLGYLNRLPFDKLKIDRRFIAGVHSSEERRNLLKGIIELGLGLGMTVVAEGAEQIEEVRTLRQLNCQCVQGYVFSHPLEGESAVRAAAMLDLMVPVNAGTNQNKRAA